MLNSLFTMIGIGIASNLDNAGVGVAYGVRKIKIPLTSNIIIAFMGFLLSLVGGFFGGWISGWLSPLWCNLIGMAVLVTIGSWVLCQQFLSKKSAQELASGSLLIRILQDPESADFDGSRSVGFVESIVLGFALSVNNLAGGFDAGITHLNIWGTSLISGLFSYLSVGLCAYLGARFAADQLGKYASAVSGVLLILVGIHQVLN